MSATENDTPSAAPTAAPTLAELNAHLFAAILPDTHALPEQDDEPKKPAGKGKAVAKPAEE